MDIEPFAMERMQSTWENRVDYNLSESGVHPLSPRELLAEAGEPVDLLLDQRLGYTQSNGTSELRSAIASMYPGASLEQVEVTNGGSEANFVSVWRLVEPGDEVALLVPNYMQTRGLSRGFGATVREWRLLLDTRSKRWRPDLDQLRSIVNDRTRLIIICTPNNPTGARFTSDELDEVARIADRHGAWVLSDEVYRGAELDDEDSATMWGRSARVIVTSGLSKAYGLPGLRIGWIVGPPDMIASLWSYHDYTTIAPGALNDRLARVALSPAVRLKLLARTRRIVRANLPVVERWLTQHAPMFDWTPPEAGAIVYARYGYDVNSTALALRLRDEHSTLVVPGDQFGMDRYLRLGYGDEAAYLREGLSRVETLLRTLPQSAIPAATA